ncbi:MAG TPA: HD domain-containing protein [Sedimentisphaerales bacterium]|nr:HD domain-containing protein [Sedimentisphaerales bacterium]
MKDCSLPTRKECLAILAEYHVPPHIVSHSRAVAKLAVFLAKRLNENGAAVDVTLLDRACLLHDLLRVLDFKESDYNRFERTLPDEEKPKWQRLRAKYKASSHEDAAYDILKEKYPALALTIKRHRYMALLDEKDKPDTWEEKLLYYADMRVMHDKIVPLKQRLAEGHKRNIHMHGSAAQSKINTAKVDPLIYEMEKEIFEKIGLDPLEVTDEFIDSY